MEPGPNDSPDKNTAFLVIHGTGLHRPYQTLDQFVRGFYKMLKNTNPEVRYELELPEVRHELKRPEEEIQSDFRLKRSDDWIRSYVRFQLCDKPYIDFYEYYWDRYVVRHITLDELGDWLQNVNKGKKAFEKELESGNDERRKKRLKKFIKDKTPFLKVTIGRFGWVLRRIICVLNYLPFDEIRDVCTHLMARKLLPNWEDTVIYNLSDRRSSYYEIREKILSGAVSQLRELMNSDYKQIIVVGHSLGTVIAHDALNRIALDASTPGAKSPHANLKKIKGLVTFGTFLDIVRLFEERTSKENSVQRVILKQRHGFRELDLPFDQPANEEVRPTNEPVDYSLLRDVKWLNFYHPDDFISNCELIAYKFNPEEGDAQVKCNKPIKAGCCKSLLYKIPIVKWFTKSMDAHGSYWEDDEMYLKIASTFF